MLSGSIKKAMKHPMGTVKVMLAWGHLATHRPNCLCVGEVLCLREMERERERVMGGQYEKLRKCRRSQSPVFITNQ